MNKINDTCFQAEILVVDDIAANLKLLSDILRAHHFKVHGTLSGQLALQALNRLKPDIILLDIKMPGMDGYEVCHAIKANPAWQGIPVIFISALDEPHDKVKAFASGGVDYINKPFQEAEVLARVKTHITLFRTSRALEESHALLEHKVTQRTAELKASERRLKQALKMASLGNWEMDLKTGKLSWSDEIVDIFGFGKNTFNVSFEGFIDSVHPEDQEKVKQAYQEAVAEKKSCDIVHRIIRKDNYETRFVHEHADPIDNAQNDSTYFFGTVQDITNLVKAEQSSDLYQKKFHHALIQTIESVAATLEKRDPYTAGHQKRVADLSTAIATEMGMDAHMIEGVRLGSSIHDIGKVHIPAEILNRPGKLAEVEFEIIKSHAQNGFEILKEVEFPWPVAQMIHQHHERLDGSGYPEGLKADEIILEARIIAVADVVEAMASHRPYRAAKGIELALAEVEKGAGSIFDPQVVEACLRLFRENRYQLTTHF